MRSVSANTEQREAIYVDRSRLAMFFARRLNMIDADTSDADAKEYVMMYGTRTMINARAYEAGVLVEMRAQLRNARVNYMRAMDEACRSSMVEEY